MNTNSNQPDPTLFVNQPKQPDAFQSFAIRVGAAVRTSLLVLFWLVVAAAGLACGYVCLRAIWWGLGLIAKALGMP